MKPDVDEKRIPVSDKDPLVYRYLSDVELDRASVEQAIREQTSSNLAERNPVPYQLNWQSDKEFTLIFTNLAPRETIHVSARQAKTKAPGMLNEDAPHLFELVFQHRAASASPSVVLTDYNLYQHVYTETTTAGPIELLRQAGTGKALLYSQDERQIRLQDLQSGFALTVPIPEHKESRLEQVHGFKHVQVSSTVQGELLDVVLSHAQVFRLNMRTKRKDLVYTSQLPILGVSTSPDGKSIGLMVARDESLRTEADLVVISDKGTVKLTVPRAAFLSHSDGYLTSYPLEWGDDHTVRVRTELPGESGLGHHVIDVATKTGEKVPDADVELVRTIRREEKEMVPYLSPDKSKLVYLTRSNADFFKELWMTDISGGPPRFVGMGRFLGWTSPDTFAWVEYGKE
ncbi:hypothetical protein J31TS4_38340 [Paenibacillus sp. J31TS4]|nr:hypothetical protein J31TS4_38340 [Paenibacillus sp. J31TS4]